MKICKYLCCCASRCFQWRNKSVLLSHLTNKETKGQRDVKQGAPLAARGPQEPGFAETLGSWRGAGTAETEASGLLEPLGHVLTTPPREKW